jgi:hypothetical protein
MLRARENRYGLLQPVRSPGGPRLYSEADDRRLRGRGWLSLPGACLSSSPVSWQEPLIRHLPLAQAGLLTVELTPLSDIVLGRQSPRMLTYYRGAK